MRGVFILSSFKRRRRVNKRVRRKRSNSDDKKSESDVNKNAGFLE